MKQRSTTSGAAAVDDLAGYAGRPAAFFMRYALGRRKAHAGLDSVRHRLLFAAGKKFQVQVMHRRGGSFAVQMTVLGLSTRLTGMAARNRDSDVLRPAPRP